MWCPAITVGFPPFVLPFDSAEADFGGGFADLLEVLARCVRGEVEASVTWVGVFGKNRFNLAKGLKATQVHDSVHGWVLNQSAILVWYSAVVCLSRNMLGTLRFYGGMDMG